MSPDHRTVAQYGPQELWTMVVQSQSRCTKEVRIRAPLLHKASTQYRFEHHATGMGRRIIIGRPPRRRLFKE